MTSERRIAEPFFTFPRVIDESVARAVAGGVVALAVATMVLDAPWVAVVLLLGFVARFSAGPRLSVLAIFATRVVVPAMGLPYRPVPGPPKRFAAFLGIVLSGTAVVLSLGFGRDAAAHAVLAALTVAAGLEAAFGYCLGCKIFGLLMRWGVVPEDMCRDCADIEERAGRMAMAGFRPDGSPLDAARPEVRCE
ncbi:MAG: DUF4395 domain-containing protein [Longimicrobiales bacterium]